MNGERRRLGALAWLVAIGMACATDDSARGGLPDSDEGFDDGAGVGGKADETGPGNFSVVRRVAVLNYNPSWVKTTSKNIPYKSAAQLANEYIRVIREASHGALEYRLANITDANFAGGWAELDSAPPNNAGEVDDEAGWLACRGQAEACAAIPDENQKRMCNENVPCGYLGYPQIISDPSLGLCARINNHEVDEVWIFGVPGYPHAAESTMVGPSGYWINNSPIEVTCLDRNVPVMFYNRERTVAQMLHNLGHRAESTFAHVYGRDEGPYIEFALPANPSTVTIEPPRARRCGSVHAPPNSTAAVEYDYANETEQPSQCMAFYRNYPDVMSLSGEEEIVSAASWGGTGLGQLAELPYLIWWFQHFPQVAGKDAEGNFNNWWRHVTLFDQLHEDTQAEPGSCWTHAEDSCPADCELRCHTCMPPGAPFECGTGGRQDLAAECAALTRETCGSLGYCALAECYGVSDVCALEGEGKQPCASPCDDPRRTAREYCEYPRPLSEPNSEEGCLWADVQYFVEDGDGVMDRSEWFCRNGEDFSEKVFGDMTKSLLGLDALSPGCFEFEFTQGSAGHHPKQQIGCSNLDYLQTSGFGKGSVNGLSIGSCQFNPEAVPSLYCGQ